MVVLPPDRGSEVDLPEHVRRNRDAWDGGLSAGFAARARKQWSADPHWGLWAVPQTELAVLPSDLEGGEVIELGCGTAYVSSWVAKAGGRLVGIDISEKQLAAARHAGRRGGLEGQTRWDLEASSFGTAAAAFCYRRHR